MNPLDQTTLHKRRLRLGLTQTELGDRCGLSIHTVKRLERQERAGQIDYLLNMSVGNLLKLCQGLDVKPGTFWKRLK